jgi:hypothetical protein
LFARLTQIQKNLTIDKTLKIKKPIITHIMNANVSFPHEIGKKAQLLIKRRFTDKFKLYIRGV